MDCLIPRRRYTSNVRVRSYLTFSSPSAFTLSHRRNKKTWDGTLYYSTNARSWEEWTGTSGISSVNDGTSYKIYLAGSGNTHINDYGYDGGASWNVLGFTGNDGISCSGKIESLLDHETVSNGGHPIMGNACFFGLFNGCTQLITAPTLDPVTLSTECYGAMFENCTSLTTPPSLPATTMAEGCYYYMLSGAGITQAPALPATTLATSCYQAMFRDCTSLTEAPSLPATTLAETCYYWMFMDCTALTTPPVISATTLGAAPKGYGCCERMFRGCTALTTLPSLSATTLTDYCYKQMFYNCTSLRVYTSSYTGAKTFRVPASGTGTSGTDSTDRMFANTGGDYTTNSSGTIDINTTYYYSRATIVTKTSNSGLNTTHGYVTIGGTKYTTASTVAIGIDATVSVYVESNSTSGQQNCYVTLDGDTVQTGEGTYTLAIAPGKTYTITVTRAGTGTTVNPYYRTAAIVTSDM